MDCVLAVWSARTDSILAVSFPSMDWVLKVSFALADCVLFVLRGAGEHSCAGAAEFAHQSGRFDAGFVANKKRADPRVDAKVNL